MEEHSGTEKPIPGSPAAGECLNLSREQAEKLYENISHDVETALAGVLAGFWGDIEEQVRLTAIASHDNRLVQDDRVAIGLLQQRALLLANRYRETIGAAFDRWRSPRPRAVSNRDLNLMSERQLEIHLAGQHVAELLEHQFQHPLYQLHERLDALGAALGLPKQAAEALPLRPQVPVDAFVKLFGDEDLTSEVRRLAFLQLEKRLSKALSELYPKINTTLECVAVDDARAIAAPTRKTPSSAANRPMETLLGESENWMPQGGLADRRNVAGMLEDQEGPLRNREQLHAQLRAWRTSMLRSSEPIHRGATAGSRDMRGARILAQHELMSITRMLQGEDPEPYVRVFSGDDPRPLSAVIRDQIASGSRQLGYEPAALGFGEVDEDAIDLVGILIQALAHSHAQASRSRTMYGRLVAPYLRLALNDDGWFEQRTHPGRRLLETISEACDENSGESPQDQQTLTRAELAVERVVTEYREDMAIFELVATELRDHLEQQQRMRQVAELRAAEAVCGRERLQHARHAVDGLLASRLAQQPLTAGVGEFLTTHWRQHLVQTWLREGPSSAQYLSAVGVGEILFKADADAAQAAGACVADRLLELQTPLERCYASCGLDATAARDSMLRIVAALAFPDTPRSMHALPADTNAAEVTDLLQWGGVRVAGGSDTVRHDLALAARMRRLRVGQNLRLIEDDGRETAAKIVWISPLTSRFLIVNRHGMRRLVVSPEELSVLVDAGRVILRSSEPPFDDALREMRAQINHPRAVAS